MRLSVSNETTYRYEDQVRASIQYLRLTPHDSERQHVLSWRLALPHPVRAQVDPFGNILHVLTMDEPHQAIVIGAEGQVDIDEALESEPESRSALPFLRQTHLTEANEAIRGFANGHCQQRRDRTALIDLMQALNEHIVYTPGVSGTETSAAQAFAERAGVCQDHSHVFLACARSLGVPARYVSGYVFSEETQQLSSHAWAEAWIDDAWYSFDVTNCLAVPRRHLKLAVGLDYLDACPVRGMRRGGCEQMHAKVVMSPSIKMTVVAPMTQQRAGQ